MDRPIGWTQHVTFGPPFIERGATQFRSSATRSKVFEADFGAAAYLQAGAEFVWPDAPRKNGATFDLRVYNSAVVSGAYTAHLMAPNEQDAFFTAFSPSHEVAVGYVWKQSDFPWMGIWEENCSRMIHPGTARRSREEWNLAYRHFQRRDARWWTAISCSECRDIAGFRRRDACKPNIGRL